MSQSTSTMENEKVKSSRRKFLKSAATLAGATIGYTWLKSSQFLLYGAEPKDESLPWYGIVIDIEKCIGCGNCAKACKKENDVPIEPFFFRTWIEQYTVKNDGSVNIVSRTVGLMGLNRLSLMRISLNHSLCQKCVTIVQNRLVSRYAR